jgi:hypothetical protein
MKNLSRRNRTILYIVTVTLILSMVISAIVSFSPSVTRTVQQDPSVLIRPTATAVR